MSCSGTCHSHINLTTKGKLLLIDVEKAKREEFNRRRKIRLQQVRQQSNEIAREIRNKVRAEKHLKCSQEELKKQAHFEKWKEAHIKTLQDDFNRRASAAEQDKENALKEAELAELEKERLQVLEEIAKKRGNLAVLKQRRDKLDGESESFLRSSNAKFNRSLENLRSSLISSLPKPDTKKSCPDMNSGSERRFASPEKRIPKFNKELEDQFSEESQDFGSVMTIIKGDNGLKKPDSMSETGRQTSASCQSSSTYSSSRFDAVSPGRVSYQKSWSYSPDKRHKVDTPISPRKVDSDCCSSSYKDSVHTKPSYSRPHSRREGPNLERRSKVSFQSDVVSHPSSQFSHSVQHSPNKRLASNILMSPSKRIAGSPYCNHSKDSSPVRCDKSYSPNKYKDDMDNIHVNQTRSRHVRFEDASSLDDAHHFQCPLGRSRAFSEGDSEIQSESDVTWPPRNWNKRQEEAVILYDHCGRTTSKYQPKHTVTVISNEVGDEGLEEEMEACRERAIRRHEETLRERRGCRAMYRQRLRAEFSCMISDLANLDKQTRLAKLETETKAALFPKKSKKKTTTEVENDKIIGTEKYDAPGRVQVIDCIDSMDVADLHTKTCTEVSRQDLMDCNLDALDQLLAKLKEQRDHLLACQEVKIDSKENRNNNVQSTSVQCSAPFSTDTATSPRETSPVGKIESQERGSATRNSRSISPLVPQSQEVSSDPQDKISSSLDDSLPQVCSQILMHQTPHDLKTLENAHTQTSSSLEKQSNKKQVFEKALFSEKSAESTLNDSKHVSPFKSADESSSALSLDATSYSFDGVKVEVKVSKNKVKKPEKKEKIRTNLLEKQKEMNSDTNGTLKNDSWAKKLAENSSSTGTSYLSPPEELNPDEHKLLISVLEGMDRKNSNPILRMYIQKLLSMSKGSLENMSVSISDDSINSEAFKSCYDNAVESSRSKEGVSQLSSFLTAQSHDGSAKQKVSDFKHLNETKSVIESTRPVQIIIESDDSSLVNRDNSNVMLRKEDYEAMQEENFAAGSQYIEALCQYNERLKLLARMMTQKEQVVKKSFSENDTSYLAVPSDINTSVKLTESAQEVGLLRPEDSYISEDVGDIYPDSAHAVTSSWGVRSNILPKPDSYPEERTVEKRPRPPSTINNCTRKMMLKSMPPHELSTIAEADSKILSSIQPSSRHQQSTSTEQGHLVTKSSGSNEEKNRSEEESYHTLPPTGFPVSSESSVISSSNVSPIKPANESSLQILTELPDSSFGQSSAEEVAVSEVFRSLGIGWALSTWRKTHEASRKIEETSSSSLSTSDAAILSKKKVDEMRYRHSTPIKTSDAEKNLEILDSDDNRLTPPSVTLYQRYQNLIRSASDSSPSNDS